jgi:DNA-binding response OmpR family regulator
MNNFTILELGAAGSTISGPWPGKASPAASLTAGLSFDPARRDLRHRNGECNHLSTLEAALLNHLMRRAGTVVSRDELLSCVWRLDPVRTRTRTIDMHVSFLRRKLGDDPRTPSILRTVHRQGYMLCAAGTSSDD